MKSQNDDFTVECKKQNLMVRSSKVLVMYPTPEVVRVPMTESLSSVLEKEHPAVFGVLAPT